MCAIQYSIYINKIKHLSGRKFHFFMCCLLCYLIECSLKRRVARVEGEKEERERRKKKVEDCARLLAAAVFFLLGDYSRFQGD